MIDERVIESMGGIKESNVILLENRRSTLEFASIFSPTTASGFANEVVLVGGKIRDWRRSHYGSNGPDWHSNHPIDVAVATNAIRNQALDFSKQSKQKNIMRSSSSMKLPSSHSMRSRQTAYIWKSTLMAPAIKVYSSFNSTITQILKPVCLEMWTFISGREWKP